MKNWTDVIIKNYWEATNFSANPEIWVSRRMYNFIWESNFDSMDYTAQQRAVEGLKIK